MSYISRHPARLVLFAFALALALAAGPTSSAHAAATAPGVNSSASVAAAYVKSLQPSMRLTTSQLESLIVDLRAHAHSHSGSSVVRANTPGGQMSPALSYWNNTFWFGHWDVAMMAGLSAVAVVGLLLTTGPIGVGTAWGIVGTVMSIVATAFFSGYCAYYVVPQHRGGTYHC